MLMGKRGYKTLERGLRGLKYTCTLQGKVARAESESSSVLAQVSFSTQTDWLNFCRNLLAFATNQ